MWRVKVKARKMLQGWNVEDSRRTDIKVRKLSEIDIAHSLILVYDV